MPIRRTKTQRTADVSNDFDEIVASALIDVTTPEDARYLRAVLAIGKRNSADPWRWYKGIGEVHYALSRGARIAGYVRLGAYKLDKAGNPGKQITRGLEADIARRLQSPYGGVRALAERYFTLMKVPAECYLIRVREGGEIIGYDFVNPGELDVASVEELLRSDGVDPGFIIKRTVVPKVSGNGEILQQDIRAEDFLGRIWRPSAEYVDVADSSLMANATNCELLDLLTKGLRAKLVNRLMANGMWFIPQELNKSRTATADRGTDGQVKLSENDVINKLLQAALFQAQNPSDPAAALPTFVSGPAQYGEAIRHIIPDIALHEVEMQLRQELIDRILMGLDVQPQDVKGVGDSNHWSAWAVSDDERRVNVQPELETMCWALTTMVLRAEMRAAGLPPGRVDTCCIWYDMSRANVKTNLAEDARQASDRGQISDVGARLLTGIDEALAPSEDEIIRWIGRQIRDPYLATFGLQRAKDIDWDKVGTGGQTQNGPQAKSPGDKPKVGPGTDSGAPGKSESNTPRKLRPA